MHAGSYPDWKWRSNIMRAQKSFLKNEEEKTKLSVVSNVSNKQALLFSVQKNILYSQKEVVKSVKNSTNE